MTTPDKRICVLITGAAGFLGTWLADAARDADFDLVGLDLRAPRKPQIWADFATSSCETTDFERLCTNRTIDVVFHLAGGASVPASVRDPFSDFSSLMPGTAKMLSHFVKTGKRPRIIFFSSAAVYGNPKALPVSEDAQLNPISPYGIHKATTETLLQYYAQAWDLPVTVLRIFSAYGPYLRKQLLWDVAQRATQAASAKLNHIALFGTGRETRDFIYAGEIARAVLLMAKRPIETVFEVFNLASGVETPVSDVANCLISQLGLDLRVQFDGVTRQGDPSNWRADVRRMAAMGFQNKVQIASGISAVAKWMKSDFGGSH